jgi:predicted transcriptional regulator
MVNFSIIIRGGLTEHFGEQVQEVLDDLQQQDDIFIVDVKSHSVDFIATRDVSGLVNRIMGIYKYSIVRQLERVIVLGKVAESAVGKAINEQAKGLFKS